MSTPARDHGAMRRRNERRGRFAEAVAAIYLAMRGVRVLQCRYKTAAGEIDIIARKGRRIAFVEVKARANVEACQASITPKLRLRVRNAAQAWLRHHPEYRDFDVGFDIVFIRPRSLPLYLKDSL